MSAAEELRRILPSDLLIVRNASVPAPAPPPAPAAPACPECGGAGWYKQAVPLGHPAFGVLFPCACKRAAMERRRFEALLARSGLGQYQDKTFATFDPSAPGVRAALATASRYAPALTGWLVLLGSYGVGKTHLAAAIAHAALARGVAVYFAVVPDLLDQLRATFDDASDVSFADLFAQMRHVDLLVLDDLGIESATAWAREKLFQIIDFRATERLPLVITSNRPAAAIEPRVLSRINGCLFEQAVVQIAANDYRARNAKTTWT